MIPAIAAGIPPNRSAVPQIMPSIVHGPTSEPQARARARIAAQERHRRVCREFERLAPLSRYYGPRRLRPIPLGQFLIERWWAT